MVSLAKKQSVSLTKQSNSPLTSLTFGLGWDPIKKTGFFGKLLGGSAEIDLDASVVLMDSNGDKIDTVWFRQLKSKCGSVIHSGDNLTGEGDGDDESIYIDLALLPENIEHLAFTVNSFRGQTFNEVENAFCRVVDQNGKELVRYELSEQGQHTGIMISSLKRDSGEWKFTAQGLPCPGQVIDDMMGRIVSELV
ncbi:TerD family protein [Marinomonas fungiae]|uniref:Stress response protein SCP2 n=1 Tax=Marinomonas fungiae TaxID=1137284 RepID=A0A0K6ITM6_9GAMM|nr:TerD family protein [Marinomonas fungiae]CUB06662.1 Stress response protein SCP2 [Marinomonas fungiae]